MDRSVFLGAFVILRLATFAHRGPTGYGLATLLGTPGCEQGVWRELFGRRESGAHSPLSCVIGLHVLDAWEAGDRDGVAICWRRAIYA